MKDPMERTWMEVSLTDIAENYKKICDWITPGCGVTAVIKADAYGLGAEAVGKCLEEAGCSRFAVADMEEALKLRNCGMKASVMTLSPIPAERVAVAAEAGIESVAVSLSQAKELSDAAVGAGVKLRVHLKMDSGLARFGIWIGDDPEKAAREAFEICCLPGLEAVGIMTHYTSCPVEDDYFNRCQMKKFSDVYNRLASMGKELPRHEAASDFTVQYPELHKGSVRVASLIFGIEEPMAGGPELKPAVRLKTRIIQIKDLPAGVPVGYGPTFYTRKPTKIAILPIGYADGIRRSLQNNYSFIAGGKPAKIIGKMAMDYTTVDITGIDVKEGDIVTVIGNEGGYSAEVWDMAHACGATVGEIPTVINKRIPRLYK